MTVSQKRRRLRVIAIVANVKQFRLTFYTMLAATLATFDIDFQVLYSEPEKNEATKSDSIDLPPPLGRKIPRIWLGGDKAVLQFAAPKDLLRADLVIVVQATGYLLNYPLLLLSALRLKKIAYWGHGRNRQGDARSFSERIKRRLANSTDWWFAYTHETKRYLESIGVDGDKITTVENSIDTRAFRETVDSISTEEVTSMRSELDMPRDCLIGLYCGSLYAEKRVDYLLDAAKHIANAMPDFRLLIVGAGPQSNVVRKACESCKCMVYVGPAFGRTKAIYFRMAEIFLNPGLVGLGILDSFAAGLPMITTADAKHSPEIAYLQNGENGLVVDGDSRQFAQIVSLTLRDSDLLSKMRRAALLSAERITVENMVENVKDGILRCLQVPSFEAHR